ncbi:hypothetical protein [Parageobacillus thermoglucosidasius]|uniref:hypothetical protein n=1 Tax=Parageobacillus thermoglucosidasius TaxID=1426 RepID=UPI000E15CA32|nr:hypothetical protein [Parageobacillus thermoglucosidasius]MED4903963.1 hypothetical protein [Parageobacillus thermoglucosidasius]MED4915713.1 hypothetical protein [Parageobacillus thermoglucosidasius]MED4945546.1 hypothetical protein [Parageobacillus thermoglucosidasius]MED4984113.1 hypothetical protein [Parageobacillus thermoglucosidasius]RDE18561.1 hypothetical protein DV714_20620 [Parageobacillus thermoglucosidasius]
MDSMAAMEEKEVGMNEQWEKLIEQEIFFYLNFQEYEAEIHERLLENELDIQYPITRFDEVEGRIYRCCPSTEEQALKRIEVREALTSLLERAKKRVERFVRAYNQLTENERELIYYTYFEPIYTDYRLAVILDFKSTKELHQARQAVLKKMLRFYEREREEQNKEFQRMVQEEKKQRAAEWLKAKLIERGWEDETSFISVENTKSVR